MELTNRDTTMDKDLLVVRFALQELASELLPGERVSVCLRWLAPVVLKEGETPGRKQRPEIHYSADTERAHYEKLIVCSRIWTCPVCAARVSEARRAELTLAVERSGLCAALVTLTMRHNIGQELKPLVRVITDSYRRLKSGRWYQDIKKEYDLFGDVRALELTYGENGWHPHIHALWLFERELQPSALHGLENELKRRFLAILGQLGHDATWEHGLTVRGDKGYVKEYIAKFGRLPVRDLDGQWGVFRELTKGNVKIARSKSGLTPWGLLLAYAEGEKRAGELFIEYARAFKGYHQLQWSRGLRERLGIEAVSDELAGMIADVPVLMSLDRNSWDDICNARARGVLLKEVVRTKGDISAVQGWIAVIVEKETAQGRKQY
jgi:hypothetical protein